MKERERDIRVSVYSRTFINVKNNEEHLFLTHTPFYFTASSSNLEHYKLL